MGDLWQVNKRKAATGPKGGFLGGVFFYCPFVKISCFSLCLFFLHFLFSSLYFLLFWLLLDKLNRLSSSVNSTELLSRCIHGKTVSYVIPSPEATRRSFAGAFARGGGRAVKSADGFHKGYFNTTKSAVCFS